MTRMKVPRQKILFCSTLILGVLIWVQRGFLSSVLSYTDEGGEVHLKSANESKTDSTIPEKAAPVKLIQKLIMPGNHTNVPPPESRIGPNGEVGYVHDPKFALKNPLPFQIPPHMKKGVCQPDWVEGNNAPQKLFKDIKPQVDKIRDYLSISKPPHKDVKLFCAVYTYNGARAKELTDGIRRTWGKKCDGLLFASNESNSTTGHMHLPSNSKSGFAYDGMIQRLRTMYAYTYDNFLDDYDYFHFSGDDVYIFVENLKAFLASDKVQKWEEEGPNRYMIAGFRMKVQDDEPEYWGGGSGYTISKKALKAYVEGPLQTCEIDAEGSAEDVIFTTCASELSNEVLDTRDSSGAHRYHQLPIHYIATIPKVRFGYTSHMIIQTIEYMNATYGHKVVYMDEYISNSTITMHKLLTSDPYMYELLFNRDDGYDECVKNFDDPPQNQVDLWTMKTSRSEGK